MLHYNEIEARLYPENTSLPTLFDLNCVQILNLFFNRLETILLHLEHVLLTVLGVGSFPVIAPVVSLALPVIDC
jgi:hypothetical protein